MPRRTHICKSILNRRDAAKVLNVSPQRVGQLVAAGQLPETLISGVSHVHLHEVEALLAERRERQRHRKHAREVARETGSW